MKIYDFEMSSPTLEKPRNMDEVLAWLLEKGLDGSIINKGSFWKGRPQMSSPQHRRIHGGVYNQQKTSCQMCISS